MNTRTALLGVNGLKAAIAVTFLARPAAIEPWVGPTAATAGGRVLLRAFGVRDLTLAVGAMTAPGPSSRRRWLVAGGLSDLVDAAATFAGSRSADRQLGSLAPLAAGWAAASGVACLALAAVESRQTAG